MSTLGTVRLTCQVVVAFLSLIILGMSANLLTVWAKYVTDGSLPFAAFALADAIITLVALLPVLVIDRVRRDAVPSWVAVELAWLGLLWILWLASAAYSVSLWADLSCANDALWVEEFRLYFPGSVSTVVSYCQQIQAIEALSFLNWIILMALWIWILVGGIQAQSAGQPQVWKSSIADFQTGGQTAGPAFPMNQPNQGYAPQPSSAPNANYAQPNGNVTPAHTGTPGYRGQV